MRKFLVVLFVLSLSTVQAGGWPKKKGTGYFKLSEWWIIADRHFTSQGKLDPNATRGTFVTSLYGEYGITDRLTAQVYFPMFVRTYQNAQISGTTGEVTQEGEALNSIGDINIGAKYGLTNKGSKYVAAATFLLGLPTGVSQGGSDGSYQTGDGEFNQMLRFDVSRSFKLAGLPAFGNLYSGFNNRTNNFSDEVRFGAEIGIADKRRKFWLFTKLDAIESLKNGSTVASGGGESLFANNSEYLSYTFEGAYKIKDSWGVTASYAGAFSGEIIFANPAYSVGVFLDLN